MKEDIINKIKSTGYWKVRLHPNDGNLSENLFEVTDIKNIVGNISVDLRGWDYPHIDINAIKKASLTKICNYVDWAERGKLEYWEFSTNGLYEHIFAMSEDYIIEDKKKEIKTWFPFGKDLINDSTKLLEAFNTIYEITEIFIFASRYVQLKNMKDIEDFELTIELYGVKDRMLYIWDQWRNLHQPYICNFEDDYISIPQRYNKKELIGNFEELAFNVIKKIFIAFNWDNMNVQVIKTEQKNLIERNF